MNGMSKRSSSHRTSPSAGQVEDVNVHSLGKFYISDNESWDLPFQALPGETHECTYSSKENHVNLTNYRLIICLPETFYVMPLRNIEQVEMKDLLELWVNCKDGRAYRMSFETPEASSKWWQFLTTATSTPLKIDNLFAFTCLKYVKDHCTGLQTSSANILPDASPFITEVKRLEFDTRSIWRISEINAKFEVCSSYPKFHIVPAWTSDKDLAESARFRSMGRFPSIVWRNKKNGAVLARSSQPEVGVFGWRCNEDEKLLSSIARSALLNSWAHDPLDTGNAMRPLMIVDARSYTAAFANRAKGGGFEFQEYYTDCQVQFMSLTNIHGIRKSFHSLRSLCQSSLEQSNWMSSLEATKWLQYLSVLIRAACVIVNVIEKDGQSVMVHCSDGWDRTAQLVSLAEIIMDPYYRTIKGFQILIEREWLDFGHKFGDRCGHSPEGDATERSPVFLQWLDCIHQLLKQFPTAFEFNEHFLVKLALHTYSCLYGTFLCNTAKERQDNRVKQSTSPVWALFKTFRADYRNLLYFSHQKVLHPSFHLRALSLWDSLYLPKTPNFIECAENDKLGVSCSEFDYVNGEIDVSINGNLIKEAASRPLKEEIAECNGTKGFCKYNVGEKDKILPNSKGGPSEIISKDSCMKNNNHNREETNEILDNDTISTEGKALASPEDQHSKVAENFSQNCNGSINESNDCNGTVVDSDVMHVSTSSSTNTLTTGVNDIELQVLNLDDNSQIKKATDNSNSEPSTPKGGKFKGHRRTHSSDGSPIKNVMKTTSYSEGMSTSAYYSHESFEAQPAKVLSDPVDNLRSIQRFLSNDGLMNCEDERHQRLREIHCEYRGEIRKLQKRVELERQARLAITQQRRDSLTDESSRRESENLDELCSLSDSTGADVRSISSISNEESWENVQYEDAQATRWVPDHLSNVCATCDSQFNLVVRKHHCRKCGRIFCGKCADRYLPLPDEQLYEPVRVCHECFRKHGTCK